LFPVSHPVARRVGDVSPQLTVRRVLMRRPAPS
jgi:hypothetical protein